MQQLLDTSADSKMDMLSFKDKYGKFPKICKQCSIRSSLIRVYTVSPSTKYFEKQLHRKQKLGHKRME